jgi:hypothetical protein
MLTTAEKPVSAKKNITGKFNGFILIFIWPRAIWLMSHKNKAKGMTNQSKNCLLNSKYSLVQGKKNKGNKKITPLIMVFIILSI